MDPGPELVPLSLLDMPEPWLADLIGSDCQGIELLQLFGSCRRLRELVLSLHAVRLHFTLPIKTEQVEAAQACLLLAVKHSSSVQLWLKRAESGDQTESTSSAIRLLSGAMAELGQGLSTVTSVEIKGIELSGPLVPGWLVAACPNLTSLMLEDSWVKQLADPTTDGPPMPPIRSLQLKQLITSARDPNTAAWWCKHLSTLPHLTSLSLHDECPQLSACSPAQLAQLTHLSFQHPLEEHPDPQHMPIWFPDPQHMPASLPHPSSCTSFSLTQVHLPRTTIRDQGLQALLNMPHLADVECSGFSLINSYSHLPCRWARLCFWRLDIASFDRLPLATVQSFHLAEKHLHVFPSREDPGANSRVVAAILNVGGLQCTTPENVVVDNRIQQADVLSVADVLPIMSTFNPRSVDISYVNDITPEFLSMVTQQLPGPAQHEMTLAFCTMAPGTWPLLLASLPSTVHTLTLYETEPTLAEVTQACVNAPRPIQLVVAYLDSVQVRWQPRWRQRLQDAMVAAGHQHVTITGHS